MTNPDLHDTFTYSNKTINVEWFDVNAIADLPVVDWHQVYAVATLDEKVPLVQYADGSVNLPGGTPEPGESIDETLKRELKEELNCRVLEWSPIGYQVLFETENDELIYQLRVYAKLEKIGPFVKDPGGEVVGHTLIELRELNTRIKYGKVGTRIMQLVSSQF